MIEHNAKFISSRLFINNVFLNVKNFLNEMIVGKSDLKSDIYDEIIFVFKNLKNITITRPRCLKI